MCKKTWQLEQMVRTDDLHDAQKAILIQSVKLVLERWPELGLNATDYDVFAEELADVINDFDGKETAMNYKKQQKIVILFHRYVGELKKLGYELRDNDIAWLVGEIICACKPVTKKGEE